MPEIGDVYNVKTKKTYKAGEIDFTKIKNLRNYKVFAFNPEKGIARYYGYKTVYTRSYISSKELVEEKFQSEHMNKARALRENIIDTVRTKISESFNEFALVDDVTSILNTYSDKELKDFAEKNKALIGYFFSYEDSSINTSDMDARLFLLLKQLGIDPTNKKYVGDIDNPNEGFNSVKHEMYTKRIEDFMDLKKVELGVSQNKYNLGNK